MATLYYESQYFSTTLSVSGGINDSITTGIVLQSVTGINDTTQPGIALMSYADPLDTSVAEWITFTSINSTTKTLVGVARGQEGFSAKAHGNGVTVAFPHSKSHINALIQQFTDELTAIRTLTNKRITKRVQAVADAATVTPSWDNDDDCNITAIAQAFTLANPSGTPTTNQTIVIRVKDNGTGRAITYGAQYRAIGITLPTTTTANKTTYIGGKWNATDSKVDCIATVTEA